MTYQLMTDVACALCDVRLFAGEHRNAPGSHGIICNDCHSIVARQCEECGEHGVAHIGERWALRGAIYYAMRNRFMIWARQTIADEEADWQWVESMGEMASQYSTRIAEFAPAYGREFWNVDEDFPRLTTCSDNGEHRCDEHCAECEECGSIVAYLVPHGSRELCSSCAMPRCDECGEGWETDLEARRCCNNGLHAYDFRPDFRYWHMQDGQPHWSNGRASGWNRIAPTDDLFIGFELETECGLESIATFLDDAGEDRNAPEFLYAKADGSLDDTGVEIVTMPATMDAIMARFPWGALRAWNEAGARSFHRGSCGFHVHVSRSYFSPTHMWRFVAWQMRNQSFCERIAQRNDSRWARWQTLGEFGTGYKPTLADVVKGKESNGERYVAINFQNEPTVELRYFRGNLREDAIRLRIEFVDALARWTRTMTGRDVIAGALSVDGFSTYVEEMRERYPTLARWIMDNQTAEWENA